MTFAVNGINKMCVVSVNQCKVSPPLVVVAPSCGFWRLSFQGLSFPYLSCQSFSYMLSTPGTWLSLSGLQRFFSSGLPDDDDEYFSLRMGLFGRQLCEQLVVLLFEDI
jgi:hypothetical protein